MPPAHGVRPLRDEELRSAEEQRPLRNRVLMLWIAAVSNGGRRVACKITVRRERRWSTVGASPTRELDRSTR